MKLTINKLSGFLLAAVFSCALLPATVAALTVNMTASETTVTMPGGEEVTMWGYSINGDPDYGIPFGPNGVPVIEANTADNLVINLTNSLPIVNPNLIPGTSVIIPGQNATTMAPVFFTDTQTRQRVQSFTKETTATPLDYTWTSLKAGTYLIQSGTHPGVQVPMGLYAVLIVTTNLGDAYTNAVGPIGYDKEVPLLFSEVDPLQHLAIAGDLAVPIPSTYGTAAYMTTMAAGYEPRYFMINGRPYSSGQSAIATDVDLVTPLVAGEDILLRFLNAGLETRQPVFNGAKFTVIAEDGNAFKPTNGDTLQQQYRQYSLDLPAGKTMDVIFSPALADSGYYTIYDRRLALVNDTVKDGGMITMLQISDPLLPTPQTLTVGMDGTGIGNVQMVSAPGGIDTAAGDLTEDLLDGAEVTLRATGDVNSTLTGWTVEDGGAIVTGECQAPLAAPYADCVVLMDDNKTVTATFTDFNVPIPPDLIAKVKVLTPNGGESIPSGSGLTIRWGAPANDITFGLAYSFGAGTPWLSIATGVTGNQYVWTVPADLPNQGPLFIAVTGYDAAGIKTTTDVSDASAARYANALTAPNGGETLATPGLPDNITWNSSLVPGTVASIGLWYRTAPATAWQLITVLQSDPGTYSWAVPATATTTAEVGIIFYDALGDPLYIDISDGAFNLN